MWPHCHVTSLATLMPCYSSARYSIPRWRVSSSPYATSCDLGVSSLYVRAKAMCWNNRSTDNLPALFTSLVLPTDISLSSVQTDCATCLATALAFFCLPLLTTFPLRPAQHQQQQCSQRSQDSSLLGLLPKQLDQEIHNNPPPPLTRLLQHHLRQAPDHTASQQTLACPPPSSVGLAPNHTSS